MKKKLLCIFIAVFIILPCMLLSGCIGGSGSVENVDFRVENGYVQYTINGTEWENLIAVNEIKGEQGAKGDKGDKGDTGATGPQGETGTAVNGREVEFDKTSTHIVWRYKGEINWRELVLLSTLKGDKGDTGTGAKGDKGNGIKSITPSADPNKTNENQTTYIITLDDDSTYEFVVKNGTNGTSGDNYTIGQDGYWYKNGEPTGVKATGEAGTNAKEVEFRKTSTHIQWRYIVENQGAEDGWTNLVELSSLKGDTGTGVKGDDGHTPYIGEDGYWYINGETTNIKAEGIDGENGNTPYIENGYWYIDGVSTGVKAEGQDGTDGKEIELDLSNGYIVWKYKGETSWRNLVDLNTLKGESGKEIELNRNQTHIQWRYKGDDEWQNLVELSSLKGEKGEQGETGLSAYQIYCNYKPKYKKSEVEWMNELISGKLLPLPTLLGDVNQDGLITPVDSSMVYDYLSTGTISDGANIANADVNADGVITKLDRLILLGQYSHKFSLPMLHDFGDVNLDNKIDEEDYYVLLDYSYEAIELTPLQEYLAIFPGAKNVQQSLLLLQQYLSGTIDNLNEFHWFINFDLDGGETLETLPMYIKDGEPIGQLPVAYRDGYEFIGWFKMDGTQVDDDLQITNNLTIIAHWSENTN